MSHPSCAIVVPVYRPDVDPFEEISLRQCHRVFRDYPIVLTGPEQLKLGAYRKIFPDSQWEPFPPERFTSLESYSRLMLDPGFYQRFTDYEFMLICQPDAFVFRDELAHWCASDYDYVGAPFPNLNVKKLHQIKRWTGRNGGLSLRRLSSFLSILTDLRGTRWKTFPDLLDEYHERYKRYSFGSLKSFCKLHLSCDNTLGQTIDTYEVAEDVFWSLEAPRLRSFRIPDPVTSAKFAIETQPHFWTKHLSGSLPAGCHAWWKYDLAFWKPLIEQCGYQLPEIGSQQIRSAA